MIVSITPLLVDQGYLLKEHPTVAIYFKADFLKRQIPTALIA